MNALEEFECQAAAFLDCVKRLFCAEPWVVRRIVSVIDWLRRLLTETDRDG